MSNPSQTPHYTLNWMVYEHVLYLNFMPSVTVESLTLINMHLAAYLEQSSESQIDLVVDASGVAQWETSAIDLERHLTSIYHPKVRWLLLAGPTPRHVSLSLHVVCNAHQQRFYAVENVDEALAFLGEAFSFEDMELLTERQ